MNKDPKDYLHLYLGCDLFEVGGGIGKFMAISDQSQRILTNASSNDPYWTNINNVQPILRPLSDINDKEARECWFASGLDGRVNYKHALNGYYYPDCTVYQMSIITNWLRKNGFDVDGLIDAGLAINKPKT